MLRFATLAGALLAGCFSNPVEDGCQLLCGLPGGSCPDGYSCGGDQHCHPSDLASPRDCRAGGGGDAGRCVLGPFPAAEVVPGVNSATDDWGPALTGDGRELYFASWRGPTSEIWVARRDGSTGDFDLPERVFAPLADERDSAPSVTSDGLALVLASSRGGADDDLWMATREDPGDPFPEPEPLAVVNQAESEWSPWLSPDRLRLYFASSRPGSDGFDVFLARRDDPDDDFRSPAPVTELNSDGAERWVRLSDDEREAFVASTRAGGEGKLDLYRFTRDEPDGTFGQPEPLAALNTAGDDVGPFLSSDGRSLYLNTGADMSGGALADISVATRSCE